MTGRRLLHTFDTREFTILEYFSIGQETEATWGRHNYFLINLIFTPSGSTSLRREFKSLYFFWVVWYNR
jgi:hypothetical protein